MLRCFLNCHLREASRRPERFDRHLADTVPPELGLDPIFLDATTPDIHTAINARLAQASLARSVHLPFFDLQPGSADRRIRQASIDRLKDGFATAKIYAPHHLIGHGAYNRFLYQSFDAWADRAADAWLDVMASWPDHAPLFLENTHETDPSTVAGLVAAIRKRLPPDQSHRVGVCFDIGHWFSFAGGAAAHNLDAWIDTLAPALAHLHLHDNTGAFDDHLAPGQGAIPFDRLFTLLARYDLNPSVTFEPHGDDAYAQTLAYVAASGGMLGWA